MRITSAQNADMVKAEIAKMKAESATRQQSCYDSNSCFN